MYAKLSVFSLSEVQKVESWSAEVWVLRSIVVYLVNNKCKRAAQCSHTIDDVVFRCWSHLEKAWIVPVSVFLKVEAIIFLHLPETLLTLNQVPKASQIVVQVTVLEVEMLVSPETWGKVCCSLDFPEFEPFCLIIPCFYIFCGPDFIEHRTLIDLSATTFHK